MNGSYPHGQGHNKKVAIGAAFALFALASVLGLAYQSGIFTDSAGEAEESLAIMVSSRRVDFGTVPVDGSAVRQLVVRNDGEEPIRATVSVDGESFSASPDTLILHPGISSRISIELFASRPGPLDDQLRIDLLDETTAPVLVTLFGRADAALSGEPVAKPGPTRDQLRTTTTINEIAPLPNPRPAAADVADAEPTPAAQPQTDPVAVIAGAVVNQASADAEVAARRQAAKSAASKAGARSNNRRRPDARKGEAGDDAAAPSRQRSQSVRVQQYDPATAPPFVGIAQTTPSPTVGQTTGEDRSAATLPSRMPNAGDDGLPEELPEDLDRGSRDIFDEDIFDDVGDEDNLNENERDEDLFNSPAFTISGLSSVRLMGHAASFYPQEIPVIGNQMGGALGMSQLLEFPQIPLAFGESMVFNQMAAVSGGFDPASGEVSLQVQIAAVDTDGDAAPITLRLTTGTALGKNPSGVVVSMTGTPRVPDTGVMRLVAIEKIPVGFKNGAEEHLAVFEILASLNFGDRRIGG